VASHNNNQNAPDINTSYPGFIYNFDPDSQTCEVQLAIENLFIGYVDAYKVEPKQRLQKVPVKFTQGGGWYFTHPVPDGTPCMVDFAQRGIDHWLFEAKDSAGMVGNKPAPAFSQLFSHESATCTVGTQPIPKAIPGFVNDVMELRNADRSQRLTLHKNGQVEIITGAAKITITKDSEITIEATSKATVKAPTITLDGDTTVTKSLTVQGGMAVSGGTGASMSVTGNITYTGNMTQNGTFTLNGIVVNTHKHTNPEGGDVGPMKS
jgi:phage baseplate assembly protein gpV